MKKTAVITGFVGVVALIAPHILFADEAAETAAPPPLSEVWIVVPKAGMRGDFVKAVTADKAIRAGLGDTRDWSVYTVAIGEHFDAIQFRACCFDWADQDAYEADSQEKGLGKNWNENVHQYVDHYHRYFEYTDWENSNWSDDEGNGPYFGVTTWNVKQGSGSASGKARKKISQVAIENGREGQWLWLSRIGGKPKTMVVTSYENYADMEPPEQSFYDFIVEKLGAEEAAALFADFSSGYSDSDYTVWRYHPGMSSTMDKD